jgi:hypothetical protein
MDNKKWLIYGAAGLVILVSCLGCSGLVLVLGVPLVQQSFDRKTRLAELHKLGDALYDFHNSKNVPASNVEQLEKGGFLKDADIAEKVRSGRYVVVWNAPLGDLDQPKGRDKSILAYDSQQEKDGSWLVMMGNTYCKMLSNDEFGSTPKMKSMQDK